MKLTGISISDNISYGNRLLKEDIIRMPSLKTNRPDFYEPVKPTSKQTNPVFWRNIFTALTFGLTGLYIAHRNDLFNPIRREAKKIIKGDELMTKVKNLVSIAINPETYQTATKKSLNNIAENQSRGADFMSEARKILSDNSSLNDLFEKVYTRLGDDSDTQRLQNGYVVDLLDKLLIRVERMLKETKNNGQDFRNKGAEIIDSLFKRTDNKPNIVEETLVDIIENRCSSTVENFVKDSILKSKFGG